MGGHQRRSRLLTSVLSFVLGGCSSLDGLGPESGWVPFDRIDGVLRPELAQPTPRAPVDGLRVVTFNVHWGEDVEGIARAVRENASLAAADLLVVQEIRNLVAEGSSRASRLAAALGMGHAYAPAKEVPGGTHGLAFLSRYPLENLAVMELPRAELPLATERRIALAGDLLVGEGRIHVIGVHLDTRLNAPERILQLRPAVLSAPPRTIVAGDFNSNPAFWTLRTIPTFGSEAHGGGDQAPILDKYMASLGWKTPTASFGPTVDFPLLEPRLDAIYIRALGSGAGAVERSVGVSDHWPVWLDVAFP